MRKILSLIICALLVVLTTLSSCTTDEATAVKTSRAFISNVQLGAIKRTTYYTNSEGERKPVVTTYKAASILMTIDQRNRVIENKEKLLYGSHLNAVLLDISYTGGYLSYFKDGIEVPYSRTDSIDLRDTVRFCVYSEDYKSATFYKLKLTVQEEELDSMRWTKVATAEDILGKMTQTKAFTLKGEACLLGVQEGGIFLAQHQADSVWNAQPTDLPIDVQLSTLRSCDDKLFVTNAEGVLYQSTNGTQWTSLGSTLPDMQLAAVTHNRLYALCNGYLWRSDHSAQTWEKERLYETDRKALPEKILAGFAYERSNGVQHIVLMGQNTAVNDSACVVWDKSWDATTSPDSATWLYYQVGVENHLTCPLMHHLQVVNYDSRLYAFGGKAIKGWEQWNAMDKALYSQDYGLTWRTEKMWSLPDSLKGTDKLVTSSVDGNNILWIIAGNEIWQGRINRLVPGK